MTAPDKFENRTLEKALILTAIQMNFEPEQEEILAKAIVEETEKITTALTPVVEKLAKAIAEIAQVIRDMEKNVKRRKPLIVRWIRRKADPVPEEPQEKEEKEKTDSHRARAPPAWKEYVKGENAMKKIRKEKSLPDRQTFSNEYVTWLVMSLASLVLSIIALGIVLMKLLK